MFVVTKDILKGAISYMPLKTKVEIAKDIADNCLKDIDTDEQNKIGESIIALPHLKGEDLAIKNVLLLGQLLTYYFHLDIHDKDSDGNDLDPFVIYDYFCEGHLLNQIERFKSDPEVKDKVFDLLADYKEFKKIVDTEIYNRKSNTNDPIPRLSAAIAVMTSKDTLTAIIEEIQRLGAEQTDRKEKLAELLEKKAEENGNS